MTFCKLDRKLRMINQHASNPGISACTTHLEESKLIWCLCRTDNESSDIANVVLSHSHRKRYSHISDDYFKPEAQASQLTQVATSLDLVDFLYCGIG